MHYDIQFENRRLTELWDFRRQMVAIDRSVGMPGLNTFSIDAEDERMSNSSSSKARSQIAKEQRDRVNKSMRVDCIECQMCRRRVCSQSRTTNWLFATANSASEATTQRPRRNDDPLVARLDRPPCREALAVSSTSSSQQALMTCPSFGRGFHRCKL